MSQDDELYDALKDKLAAQRGYADFDTWPHKRIRDGGLGDQFAVALAKDFGIELDGLEVVAEGSDPPDLKARGSIGIELTELVDSDMIRAAKAQRRAGLPSTQYRDWTKDQLLGRLREILEKKDRGSPKVPEPWIGYWLVIHTDEPALTPEIVGAHLAGWAEASCSLITRCFLMMSYFPARQGRPLFELAVVRAPDNRTSLPHQATSMPKPTGHAARITWSSEQERRGLPRGSRMVDPAWFAGAAAEGEGWSLVCTFEQPAVEQGNPSIARVEFMMPDAPGNLLSPGTTLRLLERATGGFAIVEILG